MTEARAAEVRDPKFDRVVILAEGAFDIESAKTAVGVIRYGRCKTAAVIDSRHSGSAVKDVIGFGGDIPVVSSLEQSLEYDPQSLIIGIAPRGGGLPAEWRAVLMGALDAGLDILSGLHTFLSDDPELARKAAERGCVITDVRRPPAEIEVAGGLCKDLPQNVVLTIGTDCCVGKMSVSLELTKSALARGLAADFVATGQTGILIWGRGISVDACVADFISGATEQMVLDAADRADWVFVEGQGSLYHPGYSGVTMGLIHGSEASQMILCHQPSRTNIRNYDVSIPPLDEVIRYHEAVCRPHFPTKIMGIALNTYDISEAEARKAVADAEKVTGLPATDCVRFGADKLLDAMGAG